MPDIWSISLVALTSAPRPGRGAPPKANWCGGGATGRLPPDGDELDLQDCPELRLITPSPALRHAVRDFMVRRHEQFAATKPAFGTSKQAMAWLDRMGTTLYKWELMAQGDKYDALLFSDLDMELLPPWLHYGNVANEWASQLTNLVGRTRGVTGGGSQALVRLVASPDWSSPVNAGLMLLLPPPHRGMFHRGLEVLYAPFNTTHGFNLTGTPLKLFGTRKLRRTDGTVLMHAGAPANIDNVKWDFVGADVDQGFFLYMMHHDLDVGVYPSAGGAYWARHFWGGGPKPWHLILRGAHAWTQRKGICHIDHIRSYNYLRLLALDDRPPSNSTPCMRAYRAALAELDAKHISCCPNFERHRRREAQQHYQGADFKPF